MKECSLAGALLGELEDHDLNDNDVTRRHRKFDLFPQWGQASSKNKQVTSVKQRSNGTAALQLGRWDQSTTDVCLFSQGDLELFGA